MTVMELVLLLLILLSVISACYGIARLWKRSGVMEGALLDVASRVSCKLTKDHLEQLHSSAVRVKACRESLAVILELTAPENDPRKTVPDIRVLADRALSVIKN
jgi:hypothetical protein